MILTPLETHPGTTDEEVRDFLVEQAQHHNAVVIVPSRRRAAFWRDVAATEHDSSTIHDGVRDLRDGHVGLGNVMPQHGTADGGARALRTQAYPLFHVPLHKLTDPCQRIRIGSNMVRIHVSARNVCEGAALAVLQAECLAGVDGPGEEPRPQADHSEPRTFLLGKHRDCQLPRLRKEASNSCLNPGRQGSLPWCYETSLRRGSDPTLCRMPWPCLFVMLDAFAVHQHDMTETALKTALPSGGGFLMNSPGAALAGPKASNTSATLAVHAGERPGEHNGSISMPIYMTSTFERPVNLDGGWDYSRIANPTRSALEESLSILESGNAAVATASGMAAITATVLATCRPGGRVVLASNTYGGTWDLFSKVMPQWGLEYTVVDLTDLSAVELALTPDTCLVWAETPSNPLLKITDVAQIAELAHSVGAVLAVDGTLGSPYLQSPLALGADVVVHSTTKYLGGHSDVTGGAIISRDPALGEQIRGLVNMTGSIASPMESWLVLRGIKTLPVRMSRICSSSQQLAEFLESHPAVRKVHYPGLPSHPQHALAKAQMAGFGGVVSIEVDGTKEQAAKVCASTGLFTLAVSLGGVESLIQHPAQMTHCTTTNSPAAVPDSLLRLSIGLEDPEDLIADLDQALDSLRQ